MAENFNKVISLRHPLFEEDKESYEKWRLCFKAGEKFKEEHLIKRKKETPEEFSERKTITYIPAFAKEAVLEVSRAINQRVAKVTRAGGTSTFPLVAQGTDRGIDRRDSSMSIFIGKEIIDELITMKRVGIYIDNVTVQDQTKVSVKTTDHPYIYTYKVEDILDWEYLAEDLGRLRYVLLREKAPVYDPELGFRVEYKTRYRYITLNDTGKVTVYLLNEAGVVIDKDFAEGQPIELELTDIPFILIDLGVSLMEDIADYQIALLNLASSDMNYAFKSNIPFYVEQRGALMDEVYARTTELLPRDGNGNIIDPTTLSADQREKFKMDAREIVIGSTRGRSYGKGMDAPSFISPSPDPLRVSMEKQESMKKEIRELVSVSVREIGLRFQSTDAKEMGDRPMEAGLSYIGLVLERAENQLAKIYAQYEAKEPATVKYPITYQLLSEGERHDLIKKDSATLSTVPSTTFRKEIHKSIIDTRFAGLLDPATIEAMKSEVDSSKAPTSDPETIKSDVELGILSAESASLFRGYDKSEVVTAQKEKAERLKIQLAAQSAATPDLNVDPQVAKDEKAAAQQDGQGKRGKGKNNQTDTQNQ